MHLIGVDIGTTSICGVLMNGADGSIVRSVTKPNEAGLSTDRDWEKLQDPAKIIATVEEIVDHLAGLKADVGGIGISGQMHGMLYVDRDGNHVSPLYTWQDQRGNLPCPDFSQPRNSDSRAASYAAVLSGKTGYALSTGFGVVTHYYNARNGLVPGTAATLCTIGDYAAMKLAGSRTPMTDVTNAAALGLFRMDTLEFDERALREAGIAREMLPAVVPSGTVAGYWQGRVPVFSALGDNQASVLGSVGPIGDSLLVNIGTGAQISVFSREYREIAGLETRPFPGGGYILVGAPLSGGKSYALLENFFRQVCRQFAAFDGPELYDRMNDLAAEFMEARGGLIRSVGASAAHDAESADRPIVHTQFYGTRENPGRRGSIERISPDNFTPEALIVAFLEGIAGELHHFYGLIPEDLKQKLRVMVGAGNGIRRNKALKRVLEYTFGFPLRIAPWQEEAAAGAALCAGVGAGLYRDFSSCVRFQSHPIVR